MHTSNPALGVFDEFHPRSRIYSDPATTMTLAGTVAKTAFLLVVAIGAAGLTWTQSSRSLQYAEPTVVTKKGEERKLSKVPAPIPAYVVAGSLVGLVLGFIIIFKPTTAPFLSPLYAASEGVAIGSISAMMEYMYPGIAGQASAATLMAFMVMLFAYGTGLISVGDTFATVMLAAVGGIALYYMVNLVASLFGMDLGLMRSTSMLAIGVQVGIVIVASLCLALDFDQISKGVQYNAPKYMEWYGAFSIMVTVFWMYLEFLRLLAKAKASGDSSSSDD